MPAPNNVVPIEQTDEDAVFEEYGIADDEQKTAVRVNAAARDLALRRAEKRRVAEEAKKLAENPPKKKLW